MSAYIIKYATSMELRIDNRTTLHTDVYKDMSVLESLTKEQIDVVNILLQNVHYNSQENRSKEIGKLLGVSA